MREIVAEAKAPTPRWSNGRESNRGPPEKLRKGREKTARARWCNGWKVRGFVREQRSLNWN